MMAGIEAVCNENDINTVTRNIISPLEDPTKVLSEQIIYTHS